MDALASNGMQLNGDHAVSQENGTASVAVADNTYTYLSDQFAVHTVGAMRLSGQVVSDAPAGFGQSLKLTLTTADGSLAATDVGFWEQPIEGYRVARLGLGAAGASAFVVGEWLKSNVGGTFYYYWQNSARDRTLCKAVTLVADTWTFVDFSDRSGALGAIAGDTGGTWLKTSGVGLRAGICLAAGSNFHTTAGAWQTGNFRAASNQTNWAASLTGGSGSAAPTIQRTGLVMLPGTEGPPSDRLAFAMRPFDQELMLAQRYWQKSYDYATAVGYAGATNGAHTTYMGTNSLVSGSYYGAMVLAAAMRAAPAVTIYGIGGGTGKVSNGSGTDLDASSGATTQIGEKKFTVYNANAGTVTTNSNVVIFHYKANARLA